MAKRQKLVRRDELNRLLLPYVDTVFSGEKKITEGNIF